MKSERVYMCLAVKPIEVPRMSCQSQPISYQYMEFAKAHQHHYPEQHNTPVGGQIFRKEFNSEIGRRKQLNTIGSYDIDSAKFTTTFNWELAAGGLLAERQVSDIKLDLKHLMAGGL